MAPFSLFLYSFFLLLLRPIHSSEWEIERVSWELRGEMRDRREGLRLREKRNWDWEMEWLERRDESERWRTGRPGSGRDRQTRQHRTQIPATQTTQLNPWARTRRNQAWLPVKQKTPTAPGMTSGGPIEHLADPWSPIPSNPGSVKPVKPDRACVQPRDPRSGSEPFPSMPWSPWPGNPNPFWLNPPYHREPEPDLPTTRDPWTHDLVCDPDGPSKLNNPTRQQVTQWAPTRKPDPQTHDPAIQQPSEPRQPRTVNLTRQQPDPSTQWPEPENRHFLIGIFRL
jgi:hypothetical protein